MERITKSNLADELPRHHDFIQMLIRRLRVGIDIIALIVAFVLGYILTTLTRQLSLQPAPPSFQDYLPVVGIHVVTMLSIFFFSRLYHYHRGVSRIDLAYKVVASTSVGVVMTSGLVTFLAKESIPDYTRQMTLYIWLCSVVCVTLGRELHRQIDIRSRIAGVARDRVLIVGSGHVARSIIHQMQYNADLGYTVVGAVNGFDEPDVAGVPIIGHPEDLPHLIDAYEIDDVIIALPEASRADLAQLVGWCQRGRVSIKIYPDMFAYMTGDMSVDELNGLPLITVRDIALRGWKLSLKRSLDMIGSFVGLVLLSPVMLLTAILIRLESPGPIFFSQERAGLDGRPFPMIKFRSMREDAEKNGPGWTVKGDLRVTHIGKWMRRTNWDEIPNLINVFLGQMSLVGPRPEQPFFVEKFQEHIPRYMERHREKAGMTGWAQVNGLRGDTSIVERTKYDLWYVENWSLWLDIKIILRTVIQTVMRRSENAY